MWTQGEKQLMLGVGYSIWGCVVDVTGVSLALTFIGIVYLCMSMYSLYKGQ